MKDTRNCAVLQVLFELQICEKRSYEGSSRPKNVTHYIQSCMFLRVATLGTYQSNEVEKEAVYSPSECKHLPLTVRQ